MSVARFMASLSMNLVPAEWLPGEWATFRIPPDKLHLFDAETELALHT